MNQFLIFKSDGALLGVQVSKVSGTTGLKESDELLSSSKCLFQSAEEEKYIIWHLDKGLKVKEIYDVYEIERILDVPGILANLPFLGIAVFEKSIVYLLDFDKIVDFCIKKGEENGK